MYNSIVVTNSLDNEQKIIYKFTIIHDNINWKTIVNLNINNQELMEIYSGDLFVKILPKITPVLELPFDPEGKVYDGPELKIRLFDQNYQQTWVNMTNKKNTWDKPFKLPNLYVNQNNQNIYNNIINYLTKLSDDIFSNKINKY